MNALKSVRFPVMAITWFVLLPLINNSFAQYAEISSEMKFQGGKVISMKKMLAGEGTLATVTIEPGTTVIWLNDTRHVLEVDFSDKQVTLACGAPVGFFINPEGAFSSQKIVSKAVASLCFVERGDYLFELVHRPLRGNDPLQGKTFRGKIIVR